MEDKLLELGKDLTFKIVWDSAMQKAIVLDKENLIDRAISHGIYIFFMKDMLVAKLSQNVETEIIVKFLAGLIGKSVLDVVVKLLRKREFNYQTIIINNAVGEVIGLVFEAIMGRIETPSNGNVRTV